MNITLTVSVPDGPECGFHNDRAIGVCKYFRSRACVLFNRTIQDKAKHALCLEAENRPDRVVELEGMYNAAAQEANKRGKSWDSDLPLLDIT